MSWRAKRERRATRRLLVDLYACRNCGSAAGVECKHDAGCIDFDRWPSRLRIAEPGGLSPEEGRLPQADLPIAAARPVSPPPIPFPLPRMLDDAS